jgi:hypothetical protein
MDRTLARRLVALAAAYAVAFNVLLPVLALILPPVPGNVLGPAVICSASGVGSTSDSGAPEKPQPFCPCPGACAMAGCAVAALPQADAVAARFAWSSIGPVGLRHDGGDRPAFRLGGRNFARAPPVA